MNRENPCEEMLEKKYGEVFAVENSRRQLINCMNSEVFKIDGLIFSLEENSISITFPSQFFAKPFFYWREKPSDTKVKRFYEIMKNLEKKFKYDFFIDRMEKPSSTNLSMKIKFQFRRLKEKMPGMVEATIRIVLEYLKNLWQEITDELVFYGYDIRPRNS